VVKGPGLAEAIEGLRNDLQEAVERGLKKRLRFMLSPIELTLNVVATQEANGKIGWKVLEVGGSVDRETTQELKLTLTPSWHADDGTVLTAQQFTIAAQSSEQPMHRGAAGSPPRRRGGR
jgi:hypothetical protein